jgi:hypothetical protein
VASATGCPGTDGQAAHGGAQARGGPPEPGFNDGVGSARNLLSPEQALDRPARPHVTRFPTNGISGVVWIGCFHGRSGPASLPDLTSDPIRGETQP